MRLLRTIQNVDFTGQERTALTKVTMPLRAIRDTGDDDDGCCRILNNPAAKRTHGIPDLEGYRQVNEPGPGCGELLSGSGRGHLGPHGEGSCAQLPMLHRPAQGPTHANQILNDTP